jgi:hypothetical protein
MRRSKIDLLFERTKQKFCKSGPAPVEAILRDVMKAKEQKFFASFFQKRRPSLS